MQARIAADDPEFEDKITIYNSEFIGPWLMTMENQLLDMMKRDAELEDFIELLDSQKGKMFGWLFPTNLDRLYGSGRLSRAQYMAGNLLKIIPVMAVENGNITDTEIIKKRSIEKALKVIVEKNIKKYKEYKNEGLDPQILTTVLGYENAEIRLLEKMFSEKGYKDTIRTWIPSAIVGHVGIGGVGAGVTVKFHKEDKK